ncbi:MAG TPA: mandelate racemase/muconate lactonizing enzyme family protein [Gammaproteobacteria bacterium]|nr:mandelate racemase/muconate lactonizing enzyme family protein [Gammaproteobacteria bacterium]
MPAQWNRRSVLSSLGAIGASLWLPPSADALGLGDDKIKVIRYFGNSGDSEGRPGQPMVNQSSNVVLIETERGLVGIGEGGEPRTMDECASMLIGEDPFRIDQHWQRMLRGYFYPAGREKIHSLGALDVALWDLKAKALDVPIWQLLGGKSREHLELYSTAFPRGRNGSLEDAARACMDAGFRCYRHATDNPRERVVDRFKLVRTMHEECTALHKITGDGGWAIDFHTELDPPDAINLATLLEPLHPYFCEDLIRSEGVDSYVTMRERTRVPIAVGEQFGYKWDINTLIERQLIDYARCTLPNVGGITELMKIVALAETHYVGMIPHFTGPISEAALVHCLAATSAVVLMEMLGDGTRTWPYLPKAYDFKDGKLWPNDRPGLGVEVDVSKLTLLGEYSTYRADMLLNRRPDGSFTNW